jgi:hypothetical protein
MSTIRGYTEETLRGILLICFISTIIYTYISCKLSYSKYSTYSAIKYLHHLRIKIYENVKIIEEMTKEQRELFFSLNLDCPFFLENGVKLLKSEKSAFLDPNKKKRVFQKERKVKKCQAKVILS